MAAILASVSADAKNGGGFTLERFNPTPAGELTFWVDRPDATTLRTHWQVGVTGQYAHNPFGVTHIAAVPSAGSLEPRQVRTTTALVAHEVVGHLQASASFRKRLTAAIDAPLVLQHRGNRAFGIGPGGHVSMSDVRLGATLAVVDPQAHPHLGVFIQLGLYVPVLGRTLASDRYPRIVHKAILTGQIVPSVVYAATFNLLARQHASIGGLPQMLGSSVSTEGQLGLSLSWQDARRRISVGPEVMLATGFERHRFVKRDSSSLEVLAGVHVRPNPKITIGAMGGAGFFGAPGTPDYRVLLRASFAPSLGHEAGDTDRDEDGIADRRDACPDSVGIAQADRSRHGCPVDTDLDGVLDPFDVCPIVPMGNHPDADAYGCPGPLVPPPPAAMAPPVIAAPAPAKPPAAAPVAPAPRVSVEGAQIVTDPLFFVYNKAALRPESQPVLDALAETLKSHPEISHVVIEGHTDSAGNTIANQILSEQRAQSVREALQRSGILHNRLEARGFGDTQPIAPNTTAPGRAKNRRVVFRIVR